MCSQNDLWYVEFVVYRVHVCLHPRRIGTMYRRHHGVHHVFSQLLTSGPLYLTHNLIREENDGVNR